MIVPMADVVGVTSGVAALFSLVGAAAQGDAMYVRHKHAAQPSLWQGAKYLSSAGVRVLVPWRGFKDNEQREAAGAACRFAGAIVGFGGIAAERLL